MTIKPWMRYTLGLLFLIWLLGNVPAWLFLPTYAGHNGPHDRVSYGLFWTTGIFLVPAGAFLCVCFLAALREFAHWVIGTPKETRAERIARMERDLGIGQ